MSASLGIGLFLVLMLVGVTINSHLCRAGLPWMQCVISAVCFAVVMMFAKDRRVRFPAAGIISVLMFLLADHYVELVHTHEWTGSPRWER